MDISRRMFLQGLVEAAGKLPSLNPLSLGPNIIYTGDERVAELQDAKNRILVVIQLSGGNDGINTVVPYSQQSYYDSRPNLAIKKDEVLALDGEVGLHPSMEKLSGLFKDGRLAVVQGVGYSNPNRSHYESMSIWQRGGLDYALGGGWLGRYLDVAKSADRSITAVNVGTQLPFSLVGQNERALSIDSIERFRVKPLTPRGQSQREEEIIRTLNSVECNSCQEYSMLLRDMMQAGLDSLTASSIVQGAASEHKTSVEYPRNDFGSRLKLAAQIINSDLKPRIVYLDIGGFDTHANQKQTHATLLKTVSDGIEAFHKDMEEKGTANDIMLMTFSEFGRRVKENGSLGTDHGTAEPMFMLGGLVKGGLYGKYPSLVDLTDGDLKYTVDFRQVYASVLEDWLGIDQSKVIYQKFEKIGIL